MSGRMMARVDQGFKGGCMRRHVLASIAVVIAGGVLVVAQPAAPRSTSGQADLQGTWNFSTITPLERPAEFAGKEFLTEAEAAAYEARTVQRNNRDTRVVGRRRRGQRLQRILVGPRRPRRAGARPGPHVADCRPARRQDPGADRRRPAACGGARRRAPAAPGRRSGRSIAGIRRWAKAR